MKKFLVLSLLIFVSITSVFSQSTKLDKQQQLTKRLRDLEIGRKAVLQKNQCAYDDIKADLMKNPAYKAEQEKFQTEVTKYVDKHRDRLGNSKATVYTIPVVFHVMHIGEAVGVGHNISDAQIMSAIEGLNRDYRRTVADGGIGAGAGPDAEIQFCLASKDPSGNPHSGINRINASGVANYENEGVYDGTGYNGTTIKNLSKWPTTDYVNVWIVREIKDQGEYGSWSSGTLGYAYPVSSSTATNPNTNPSNNGNDGIVVVDFAIGNDPDNSEGWNIYFNKNRTLTHEMGHHLNLQHTFQGGSCTESNCAIEGDFVCDTPPTPQNSSCGTPACSGTQQVENYMDYTGEACQDMFSAGQVARMRAVLEGFSRSSLTSSDGCGLVPPTADFAATNVTPCLNATIEITDESLREVDTYAWTITPATYTYVGGTNSNSQDIQVQFTAAGLYTVSLTVTNGAGSDSETKTDYISAGIGKSLPFTEDWEDSDTYGQWSVSNPDGLTTWSVTTVAGNTPGDKAAFVSNVDYDAADGGAKLRDGIISPTLDLSGYATVTLNFDQAYARYNNTYQDSLAVYVSTDCGGTFTKVAYFKDASLKTRADVTTGAFTPAVASDWCGVGGLASCIEIDLSAYAGQSTVQIMWENISNYGNNLYVDNINVTGIAGAAPVADFTASDTNPCEGISIDLTDQSTETPTSWLWTATPSAGAVFTPSNTAQNPSITFANAGDYTISLEATNATGADTETKTDFITVIGVPEPTIEIVADESSICEGETVTFTATAGNTGSSTVLSWYVNNIIQAASGTTFEISTLSNGDEVKARIISVYPCGNDTVFSNEVAITVTGILDAGISIAASSTAICIGEPVVFTATLTDEGSTNVIEWYVNNVLDGATGPSFTTTSLADGDKVKARVIATYACGNDTTISNIIAITVGGIPKPTISIASDVTSICPGDDVVFTSTVTNEGQSSIITWFVNSIAQVQTGATYTAAGLSDGDEIKAKIVSTYSCGIDSSESNAIAITVSLVQNPLVSISVPTTTVCIGEETTLRAAIANAGAKNIDWFFNNTDQVEKDTLYTTTITANNDAVFARLISTTSCSIDTVYSDTLVFTILTQDTAKITSFSSTDSICAGEQATFEVTVANANVDSVYWFVNNTLVIKGASFSSNTLVDGDEVYAKLVHVGDCRIDSALSNTTALVVNANPVVSFTPNQLLEACINADLVQLIANPTGGTFTGAGVNNATKQFNPSAVPPGQLPIYYVYESPEGCEARDTIDFTVFALPTKPSILYASNTLTSSETATTYTWYKDGSIIDSGTNKAIPFQGDGDYQLVITDANGCENISDVSSLTNIISTAKSASVLVYPNPAKSIVNLKGVYAHTVVKMYDVLGKEIQLVKIKLTDGLQIDLSGLAKGTYLIHVDGSVHHLVVMD